MPEYIPREAVLAECCKYNYADHYDKWAVKCLVKSIPAADVVAVVRCKECEHWDKEQLYCHHPAGMTFYGKKCANEGFCYFGERRAEDEV